MKLAIQFLILILVSFSLVACGGKDGKNKRGRVGDRSARDRVAGGELFDEEVSKGSSGWGQIYRDSQSQPSPTAFQDSVDAFVSANMDPYAENSGLGTVSGELGADTGIWFTGSIPFTNGFDGTTATSNIDQGKASFALVVWDSFASQKDSRGNFIGGYGFSHDRSNYSSVQGNRVTVEWADEFGHVWLDGQFNNQYFEGYAYFYNLQNFSPDFSEAQDGVLGRFVVPTCQFFVCN